MSTSPRALALELLLRCEAAGQYANIALDTALERAGAPTGPDRALCTALFYGVIEHRVTLDHVIDSRASLPPSAIEARVRMILRMALCQLLYFDRIPDHAAINEAVSMAGRRSKGFVNAVLRGFCRDGKRVEYPDPKVEPAAYLSVRYSLDAALAAAFLDIYGLARAESVLQAFSQTPPVTVRVNTARLTREAFLSRYGGKATKFAPFGVILESGANLSAMLEAGDCFVQDEASQIAVQALDVPEGARVIDLCAAPGSKSFGAALVTGEHGRVFSFDLHQNKLSLIQSGAARLGLSQIEVAQGDARAADPERLGRFPRVICDVPCSGYGVLAKKPDIRYKPFAAAAGLLPVQAAILERAAALVEPDGILLYSTCTLLPAENEGQVKPFLAAHGEFELCPFSVGGLAGNGMLTLTPDEHGTDGFFVAKLHKKV